MERSQRRRPGWDYIFSVPAEEQAWDTKSSQACYRMPAGCLLHQKAASDRVANGRCSQRVERHGRLAPMDRRVGTLQDATVTTGHHHNSSLVLIGLTANQLLWQLSKALFGSEDILLSVQPCASITSASLKSWCHRTGCRHVMNSIVRISWRTMKRC
jgi:hypothetical protein